MEKPKDVLEVSDSAVSVDVPEEAKQAMTALSVVMNSVCYMYNAGFCHL